VALRAVRTVSKTPAYAEAATAFETARTTWSGSSCRLVDVKVTESGVGTYFSSVMTMSGRTVETGTVCSEVAPNELMADKSSIHLHGSWRYEFAPEGTGARLTMQGEPRGLWPLPDVLWLAGRVMGPRHEQVLARLKETHEQTDHPVGSPAQLYSAGTPAVLGRNVINDPAEYRRLPLDSLEAGAQVSRTLAQLRGRRRRKDRR
jgi:hypothetical protein